jgi:exopolysaccharide biosynthesis protein
VALMVAADVIAAALLLLIFYVTNYEMHSETGPIESLPVPSWMTSQTPDPGTSSAPTGTAEQASATATIDLSDWRAKFPDKFTDGEVERTDTSYRSANISVTIEKVQRENLTYFVADIYVAELKYFRTAFAREADTMGYEEPTPTIAKEVGAIIAINGDFCNRNKERGVVLRNGQPYHKSLPSSDQFVMFYDGTMKAMSPEEFDYDTVTAAGAYQIWTWGPMILDDGQPMTEFNMPDSIGGANPRTALGYFEPGHYCFVLVDGGQGSYSEGLRLPELSQLMYDLGCTEAYNLDGGHSSEMAFFGEFVNHPEGGGRRCSDIVYIGEE